MCAQARANVRVTPAQELLLLLENEYEQETQEETVTREGKRSGTGQPAAFRSSLRTGGSRELPWLAHGGRADCFGNEREDSALGRAASKQSNSRFFKTFLNGNAGKP